MSGRLDRTRKRLDEADEQVMDRLATTPGYGPARDSPSRFQRWLMGAPTPVASGAWGLCMGVFVGLLILLRGGSLVIAGLVIGVIAVAGGLLFETLRHDRGETREHRLETTVKYLPTLRRRR